MLRVKFEQTEVALSFVPNYEELIKTLKDVFDLSEQNVFLTYIDDDQDHIHVSNQQDILAMIDTTSNSPIQMIVHQKQTHANLSDNTLQTVQKKQQQQYFHKSIIQNNSFQLGKGSKTIQSIVQSLFNIKKQNRQDQDGDRNNNNIIKQSNEEVLNVDFFKSQSESVQISNNKKTETKSENSQNQIQNIVDDKIMSMIPFIVSVVQKNLQQTFTTEKSKNKIIEKAFRLKHKRVNKILQMHPQISIIQIQQIVNHTLDLEYGEVIQAVNQHVALNQK